MFLRFISLWVVLLLVNFCRAAVLYKNSTPPATPAFKILESPPSTITPSATLSYANVQSTTELFPVTPGPYWGNQTIPINTCTSWNLGGITPQLVWTPCHIFAGTVQLSYFPPASGNVTYPSTYYNEAIGVTMTSPSMYMVINTISGYNSCGQVGPTMSNIVISMDPTDVSTIALYTASDQNVNTTPAAMLILNDIISGCSTITMTESSTNGAIQNSHALANDYNRCFPALAIPTPQIESLGLHCGQDNARFGLFDPPGAVPHANALLPVTSARPVTSTSMPASTAQLPSPNQPSKTASANVLLPSTSTSAPQVQESKPASPDTIVPSIEVPSSSNVFSTSVLSVQDPTTIVKPLPSAAIIPPNTPIPIATIASSILSVVPGDSTIVVGGQTASLGGAPITISSSLVQLTPSGVIVADVNGDSSQSSIYTIPTAAAAIPTVVPSQIATLAGGEVISAITGASTLVVAGQTIISGAPAITLSGSNSVASLGSQGFIIQGSDGAVSTYSLPTAAPAPAIVPSAIATLAGGEIVSAIPGASTLIIAGQTITSGVPATTLSGSHAIASLGAQGLVIQGSDGSTSTYSISLASPSTKASVPIATLAGGEIISALESASSLILGSQTLSLNGPAITLSNSIATLGAAGLIMQYPGGIVSTFPLPTSTPISIPISQPSIDTSITEIRTSEIIIYSSGKPVTTSYTTSSLTNTNTRSSNEPGILAIQTGNGTVNENASETESASMDTITNIVLAAGAENLKRTGNLFYGLKGVGLLVLGFWGLWIG
ncbi:hypothetical protein NHQ30_010817 [Ciborinia camelliae]|nr:hypothetical protein NHQ30_010817 [Ciborinia camelliae]